MLWLRRMVRVGVLAVACCMAPNATHGQGAAPQVDLKVVKYDELCDLVRANQGKVILLDFWANSCIPCKKNFPHVVEMYKKYAGKGLVVISVATDNLNDEVTGDPRPRLLKFLVNNDATFTNVLLDEPTSLLVDKLRVSALPCVYIFDRQGKWRHFIGDNLVNRENGEVRHTDLEALIIKLLD